ncbi:MAG: cytochrome P450, partial [Pseudomonadota bacterium]|nr:cytochrome P450 [Pseudomonadota bacterium]
LQSFLKGREPMNREVADGLLDDLRGAGTIEFMQDFSIPFATARTCRIMGFRESDTPMLKHWSGLFFYLFHSIPGKEVLEQVNQALAEFRRHVGAAVEERRRNPRDDFLTVLMQASKGDFAFNEREVVDNCMLLTADGIENPQTGLATAVATLLRHGDQLKRLQADPTLVGPAVEECLRYESPGQYQGRVALETVEIGGKTIRANSVVLHVLAAANRDPAVFPRPDRFDIDRNGARHLAFGVGQHACIGGTLVGMEFRAALSALFDGSREFLPRTDRLEGVARAGHRWPAALPLDVRDL